MADLKGLHDAGWAQTADRAALYADPTTPARKSRLRRYLADLPPKSRVLDYGCGRGEFCEFLRGIGFSVAGLDLSPVVIEYNRRDFPDMEFEVTEAGQPAQFPDESFDAIWCSEVIEHVYDVNAIFADFARLLQPGGKLLVTTPYHGRLKNLILALFGFEKHFNVEWQHIRFWTRKSLAKVAAAHGLRPVAWDTVGRVSWLAKSFFAVFRKDNDAR